MKLDKIKHDFDQPTMTTTGHTAYWSPEVLAQLARRDWARTHVRNRIDLSAWQGFTRDLPRDPYVDQRWKRMAWLALDESGRMQDLGHCPMAQGGAFNNAESMADKLRYYAPLTEAFVQRHDVRRFVEAWARLWGLHANEPILFQITGVRGEGSIDPLQGQGIHADGCKALSIMVVSRHNLIGADNHLYADKAGQHPLADTTLDPGDILHLRDDRLFHSVDAIRQEAPHQPFERFIIIINSRFVDPYQNRILRRHFPDAILHEG
ncbi:2OG-Fe dioxygenase family protein [Halomonas sp. 18H]|uniref:2OG-Fe dioxygenase family protein n=1 Tax=Halomonas almeriensis TaxID=308163 RepID=UPI00223200AA|nr:MULTISPECIES: 2OG-Fe dioxygenase family protein [Halomonas]MCW4151133.1 2OG-Fe dioxygenase family protein [Halomonas sp. 18H]MDN3553013.1 2OG-Fe dioxygenase family protein [Halomonas almeriensis]